MNETVIDSDSRHLGKTWNPNRYEEEAEQSVGRANWKWFEDERGEIPPE
ncbi:MAG: hypothetical protein H6822_36970 [Planctomycetaceae bacterium]|nr:hypothetical protein [Planctomycetaceae bacterium]